MNVNPARRIFSCACGGPQSLHLAIWREKPSVEDSDDIGSTEVWRVHGEVPTKLFEVERRVSSMTSDSEGELWMGTWDRNAILTTKRSVPGQWIRTGGIDLVELRGLADVPSIIMDLAVTPSSVVVAFANGEIYFYHMGAFHPAQLPEPARPFTSNFLRHAGDGSLYSAGHAWAYYRDRQSGWQPITGDGMAEIVSLGASLNLGEATPDGSVLAGTSYGAVWRLHGTTAKRLFLLEAGVNVFGPVQADGGIVVPTALGACYVDSAGGMITFPDVLSACAFTADQRIYCVGIEPSGRGKIVVHRAPSSFSGGLGWTSIDF